MFDGKPLHSRFAGYLNSSPPTFGEYLNDHVPLNDMTGCRTPSNREGNI